MVTERLIRITASSAVEVCKHFVLRDAARPLLRDGLAPGRFLDVLVAHRQHAAAVDFLAHALPAREAIWWGCLCVQQASGSSLSAVEAAACKAAVAWVLAPSEENRAPAQAPGEAAGSRTPAGLLAMATTWTGGSLAPITTNPDPKIPPIPPVPPGPFLPAKAVAGAILLAAVKSDPPTLTQRLQAFVDLGIGVAEGRFVWPEMIDDAPAQREGVRGCPSRPLD